MTTTYKCRLCLNEITKKIDIFKDDFPKMIELLSGLKVCPNDGLLKTSCLPCARDVKFCMSIRKQILQSHRILSGLKVGRRVRNNKPNSVNKTTTEAYGNKQNLMTVIDLEAQPENVKDVSIENCEKKELDIQFEEVTINSEEVSDKFHKETNENQLFESIKSSAKDIKTEKEIKVEHSPLSRQESQTIRQRNIRNIKFVSTTNLLNRSNDKRYSNVIFVKKTRQKRKDPHLLISQASYATRIKLGEIKSVEIQPKIQLRQKRNESDGIKKRKNRDVLERVVCEVCKKEVKNSYLKSHMKTHYPTHFTCEICGANTKNLRGLSQHKIYWHTKHLDYICDKCGKKYRSTHALALHEKKEHGGVRDFECKICGKKFFQNMHLKRHVDGIHKKLRPHKCEYCGKDFSKRTHLVTHRRTHTNETPFSCDMCGERFKLKLSMKSHLKRVHNYAEEKKFFCNICERGFPTDTGLRAHLNSRVHEGRKCNFCFEVFTDEYMQNHLIDVHGMHKTNLQQE